MVRQARGGEAASAAAYVPGGRVTLKTLAEAARGCRGCDLYKHATQTVFGAGRKTAKVMLIGEQPGDQGDRAGEPFVGPAGKLLDQALVEAGIERGEAYVTNTVKHFKYEPRGKKRIHKKRDAREIAACRPWLEKEIEVVKPMVIIALGATAAQAMFGKQFRVTRQRGQVFESVWAKQSMATVHPSSILRAPSDAERRAAYAAFVEDLKRAADVMRGVEDKE
jgi:DNA polymerase